MRDAEIINTADNKSVAKYFLDFPIFSGDNFEISFIGSNLSKFKDLVGKFFVDPGSIEVTNESQIVRSSGIVADGYLSGSRVFHDLNENGIFDENNEVFVTSFDDGSFKGLHGDVAKPLVAVEVLILQLVYL